MINIQSGAIGHGSNTNQSGAIGHANPAANPIGATGHGSNTNQSGAIDINNTNTDQGGQASNGPTVIGATGHGSNTDQGDQAITINKPVENPTGATGNGSNTDQSGAIDNSPTINPDAIGNPAKTNKGITDLYKSDGDDYTIDDNALSNAQMRTGDDKKADSVVGSGGSDGSETNSNINTGVFGGPARAAHPGYSLW